MASHELALAFNVIDIAVLCSGIHRCSTRIAVLHSGGISLYEWKLQEKLPSKPSLISSTELPSDNFSQSTNQQIVFMDDHSLLVWHTGPESSSLSIFATDDNTLRYDATSIQRGIRNLIGPAATVTEMEASSAYIFLDNSELRAASSLFSKSEEQHFPGRARIRLPTFTPRIEVVESRRKTLVLADRHGNGPNDIDQDQVIAFGLTDNGSLYANERQLARNCTSFLLTPAHLIFTTTQHLVKFVHMAPVEGVNTVPTSYERVLLTVL